MPVSCLWDGCYTNGRQSVFQNEVLFYNHTINSHLPKESGKHFCQMRSHPQKPICGTLIKHKAQFYDHIITHFSAAVRPYTCEVCSLSFRNRQDLAKHGRKVHVKTPKDLEFAHTNKVEKTDSLKIITNLNFEYSSIQASNAPSPPQTFSNESYFKKSSPLDVYFENNPVTQPPNYTTTTCFENKSVTSYPSTTYFKNTPVALPLNYSTLSTLQQSNPTKTNSHSRLLPSNGSSLDFLQISYTPLVSPSLLPSPSPGADSLIPSPTGASSGYQQLELSVEEALYVIGTSSSAIHSTSSTSLNCLDCIHGACTMHTEVVLQNDNFYLNPTPTYTVGTDWRIFIKLIEYFYFQLGTHVEDESARTVAHFRKNGGKVPLQSQTQLLNRVLTKISQRNVGLMKVMAERQNFVIMYCKVFMNALIMYQLCNEIKMLRESLILHAVRNQKYSITNAPPTNPLRQILLTIGNFLKTSYITTNCNDDQWILVDIRTFEHPKEKYHPSLDCRGSSLGIRVRFPNEIDMFSLLIRHQNFKVFSLTISPLIDAMIDDLVWGPGLTLMDNGMMITDDCLISTLCCGGGVCGNRMEVRPRFSMKTVVDGDLGVTLWMRIGVDDEWVFGDPPIPHSEVSIVF